MSISKILFFISLFLANTAYADSAIKIKNAWSPEAPPVVKVMAGYMDIYNHSNKDVKIISAKSDYFNRIEIHLSKMKNGLMSMIKQENLNIKANDSISLKQGGLHMMLITKLKPIKAGSTIPVSLTFDNGETKKINLNVKKDNEPEMKCGSMMKHH